MRKLDRIFAVQEGLALSKQELQAVELEYNHFKRDQIFEFTSFNSANSLSSTRLLNLWLQFQAYTEKDVIVPKEWWNKCLAALQWWWMNLIGRYVLKLNSSLISIIYLLLSRNCKLCITIGRLRN